MKPRRGPYCATPGAPAPNTTAGRESGRSLLRQLPQLPQLSAELRQPRLLCDPLARQRVAAQLQARRVTVLRGTVNAVGKAFRRSGPGAVPAPNRRRRPRPTRTAERPARTERRDQGSVWDRRAPAVNPHLRRHSDPAAGQSYTPVQVAAAYSFPSGVTGTGQTAGIIEFGGGYNETDLANYFASLGLTAPTVSAVSVDAGTNSPDTDQNADGEVILDIEVLGSAAPGATIVVYFAPNTDQGFLDAVSTAVHDTTNKPSVVSISWGAPEDSWTGQARTDPLRGGLARRDRDGRRRLLRIHRRVSDGKQHVDFLASAPHALGCGGSSLQIANGQFTSETVWNDLPSDGATGGGISIEFPVPAYQSEIQMPTNVDTGNAGRGVRTALMEALGGQATTAATP